MVHAAAAVRPPLIPLIQLRLEQEPLKRLPQQRVLYMPVRKNIIYIFKHICIFFTSMEHFYSSLFLHLHFAIYFQAKFVTIQS